MNDLSHKSKSISSYNLETKTWSIGTLRYTKWGLFLLFAWLLWGDFAWSIRERSAPQLMQVLLKKYGASDTLNGLLVGSLPQLLVLVIIPIISFYSDNFRSRWGRRIPFLICTTPFAVFTLIGLSYSKELGDLLHHFLAEHSPGNNASTLIVLGSFWIIFELAVLSTNALFLSLVNDVVPHEFIGRFFGLFRVMSLTVGIIFNYAVFGHAEDHSHLIFLYVALIFGIGFTMMCLNVKEGEYPAPLTKKSSPRFGNGIKLYFKECFSNKYYVSIFIYFALCATSLGPLGLFAVFYAKSLGMSLDQYGKATAIMYAISLLAAYPVGWLSDKFHSLRVSMISMILNAVICFLGGMFVNSPFSFSLIYIATGVFAGAYWTSSSSLAQKLFPQAQFAVLNSAVLSAMGVFGAIMPLGVGLLMDFSNKEYRLLFLISGTLSILGVAVGWKVYRQFCSLGGMHSYRPPEP